jgi:hypothetical protein
MENFNEYTVIVAVEVIDGEDTPIIEQQLLEESDVAENYVWADEEQSVLKKKSQEL